MFLTTLLLTTVGAQDRAEAIVDRVYGAQIGLLGIWGYGEFPIHRQVVLRTDIGLDAGIRGGSQFYRTVLVLTPSIRLEPRWYYNLAKRSERGKPTNGNAANYFSIPVIAHPGWFRITNEESISVDRGLQLLPTWGIRRSLGNRLMYEVGAGLGYGLRWAEGRSKPTGGTSGWIRFRIGL